MHLKGDDVSCHCFLITTLVSIMIYLLLNIVKTVVWSIYKAVVQND
jgi:hypothetical protein